MACTATSHMTIARQTLKSCWAAQTDRRQVCHGSMRMEHLCYHSSHAPGLRWPFKSARLTRVLWAAGIIVLAHVGHGHGHHRKRVGVLALLIRLLVLLLRVRHGLRQRALHCISAPLDKTH